MSDRHYVHHEDEVALAKILKESKPWLEQYGTTIIYGIAAVLAVSAVVVYIARRPPATAGESSGLLMASSPEDYQTVADSAPDTPIGVVARVRQAELWLDQAVGQLFTDREKSVESLDKAARTFENLADRKDLSTDLRERVLAGVARALECRCDGTDATVNPALEAWEKLLKDYPDSKKFKDIAESRVKALKSDKSKAFYAWFHTQNPKASDELLLPQDGPGKVPDVPKIDIPDFTTPGAPAEGAKTDGAKSETPAAPSDATPAAEGTPAPEAKPAPAEGTPAPEAKPAPAEGTPAPEANPAPTEGTPAPEKSGE
ncbi:MAG: hypothetical protein U0936_16770 [Planctomycetaceae bacterium]